MPDMMPPLGGWPERPARKPRSPNNPLPLPLRLLISLILLLAWLVLFLPLLLASLAHAAWLCLLYFSTGEDHYDRFMRGPVFWPPRVIIAWMEWNWSHK